MQRSVFMIGPAYDRSNVLQSADELSHEQELCMFHFTHLYCERCSNQTSRSLMTPLFTLYMYLVT